MSDTLQVWKFPVRLEDEWTLSAPRGFDPLSVQIQGGEPFLWATVDPNKPAMDYTIRVAGTGHPIEERRIQKFVGTFQLHGGALVFHIFLMKD